MSNPLSMYEGRLNRSQFISRLLILIGVTIVLVLAIPFASFLAAEAEWIGFVLMALPFIFIALMIYYTFSLYVRRLRDMNYSPLLVLLMFLPLANIVLLLMMIFKKGVTLNI